MVGAEDPVAAFKRVLAQSSSRRRLAYRDQGKDEVAGGGEGVRVVWTEAGPPAAEQRLSHSSAGVAVTTGLQIADGFQDQSPACGGGVGQCSGGEHVRGQRGVGSPAMGIIRVDGAGGGE